MRILLTAATALPLLLTSITFTLAPTTPSLALPANSVCTITTYYSNASLETQVGERTVCTGTAPQMTGHTTRWHTSERIDAGPAGPGGGHTHGGGGSLPCEFLQAGCSNLPVNRYD